MVVDRFVDPEASGHAEFTGWRCLLCGNILDPVIVANRDCPPVSRPPLRERTWAA
jgi:hypothetical protein